MMSIHRFKSGMALHNAYRLGILLSDDSIVLNVTRKCTMGFFNNHARSFGGDMHECREQPI